MNCPVCNIKLNMMDRHGVEIDYCPQCRGVWLDRGELDKIIERTATGGFAANTQQPNQSGFSQQQTPPPQSGFNQPQSGFNQPYNQPPQSGFNQPQYPNQHSGFNQPHYPNKHYGHHKKHKKHDSFLGELFDFD